MIEAGSQSAFYVSHQGTEQGPFTINEILELLESKKLLDIDYMFVEAQEDWVAVGEFLTSQGIEFTPPEVTSEHATPQTYVEESHEAEPSPAVTASAEPQVHEINLNYDEPETLPDPESMEPVSNSEEELSTSQQISLADITPPDETQLEKAQEQLQKIESINTATNIEVAKQYEQEFADEDTQPNAVDPSVEKSQLAQEETQVGVESPQENLNQEVESAQVAQPPATPPPKLDTTSKIEVSTVEGHSSTEEQDPPAGVTGHEEDNTSEISQSVELQNGEADIEIDSNFAGKLVLSLEAESDVDVDLTDRKEIQVAAGKATKLVVFGPTEIIAGETITLNFLAHDDFGNLDINYSGTLNLSCEDCFDLPDEVQIAHGVATIKLDPTVAAQIKILVDSSQVELQVQDTIEFQVVPGAASQLVIESPEELPAGETLKVKIKALDKFGNPTRDFTGKVQLKIQGAVEENSAEATTQNTTNKPSKPAPHHAS